jgi:hypothetical protein
MDYLKLYDLERYLFDVVRANFERDGACGISERRGS